LFGLPLEPGARGEAVRDLQRRLTALGQVPGGDAPGHYGDGTTSAVRAFQRHRGLRTDGVCGAQTWSALVEAGYRLGQRLLYRRTPMLRGDDVATLQRRLGALGFDAGRIDGIFGDGTAAALVDFQRNAGLTVDGICGPASIAALDRLAAPGRDEEPVAGLREREHLLEAPRNLEGRRVAVGHEGGLPALVTAAARALAQAGAEPLVLADPDGSRQASEANLAGVDVYVGLRLDPHREGASTCYYAGYRYESAGGRRLAELLQAALTPVLNSPDLGIQGMSIPILRETRMPAVVCEMGPGPVVVERSHEIAAAVVGALARWSAAPCD